LSKREVAALTYFGLVDEDDDGTWSLTQLGARLLQHERISDRRTAFFSVPLYRTVMSEIGSPWPVDLEEMLVEQCGISSSSSSEAKANLIASADYAGLLYRDDDGLDSTGDSFESEPTGVAIDLDPSDSAGCNDLLRYWTEGGGRKLLELAREMRPGSHPLERPFGKSRIKVLPRVYKDKEIDLILDEATDWIHSKR
jgi:hypothetical protein